MSKVKNLGFDNVVADCKAGCSLRDGCEAFNLGSDARCINLRSIDIEKCENDKAYDLYRHGRYTVLHLFAFFTLNFSYDSIACMLIH